MVFAYFASIPSMKEEKDIDLTGEELNVFLADYFSYYRTLDISLKVRFVDRLLAFIHSKSFISPKGMNITNKVKAIVSASAIQLTLGLENWKLNYFETIIIFPSEFKNQMSGLTLKGETNLSGFVSLSWKNFIEGYQIPNDNLNLGLHEFTHALRFSGVRGHETDEFFSAYFTKWYAFANAEFLKLKNGEGSIFRKYGGANINEFLSVAIEHFFESPLEFEEYHPDLYSATAILLNQKTNGKITSVNIRKEELKKMDSKFDQLPSFEFKAELSFTPALICLSILIYTAFASGVFSFPSLFMASVTFILFLRSDYRSSHFHLENGKIILSKGFLFFKNRASFTISPSQIIKICFEANESNSLSADITFFTEEGAFYEETFYLKNNPAEKENLVKSLQRQYIWTK
jgi:hypothetical protein